MEIRDLLIKNVKTMFPGLTFVASFQQLVDSLQPGIWSDVVPTHSGVTIDNIVNVVVDRAMLDGWIGSIVDEIDRNPSNAAELDVVQAFLREQPKPTHTDPFKEVLLDGNRPFANRVDLRLALKSMCAATGSPVLVVTGEPKTGKSFSFYLAQHIARQHGYVTSQFELGAAVTAESLAIEVMRRVGVAVKNNITGLESEERTGKDLADQVKDALDERKQKRVFVFDGFPLPTETPLPPETMSFIVRLAKYADEELRPFLRLVLIRFSDMLPEAIEDVAERDQAQPFTDADMLAVLSQVATSRGWDVSQQALKDEIARVSGKSMRERFQLMRKTVRRLSEPPDPAPTPPAPPIAPPAPGGQP